MISPTKLNNILREEMHALSAEYSRAGTREVLKYQHNLEFGDYKTFKLLRKLIEKVELEEDLELQITGVEPTLHVSDNSIEARMKVTVREEFNRHAEEHTQLSEFEEDDA